MIAHMFTGDMIRSALVAMCGAAAGSRKRKADGDLQPQTTTKTKAQQLHHALKTACRYGTPDKSFLSMARCANSITVCTRSSLCISRLDAVATKGCMTSYGIIVQRVDMIHGEWGIGYLTEVNRQSGGRHGPLLHTIDGNCALHKGFHSAGGTIRAHTGAEGARIRYLLLFHVDVSIALALVVWHLLLFYVDFVFALKVVMLDARSVYENVSVNTEHRASEKGLHDSTT